MCKEHERLLNEIEISETRINIYYIGLNELNIFLNKTLIDCKKQLEKKIEEELQIVQQFINQYHIHCSNCNKEFIP